MNPDAVASFTKRIPLSSAASYVGAAVLLAASRSKPSAAKTVISVGSAVAMAFYAAEVHEASALRGHKHSAVIGAFVGVSFMSQAARIPTPANWAVAILGWGLACAHGLEWQRLHNERVDTVRAQLREAGKLQKEHSKPA
jgi:hypothetical protein